MSAGSLSTPTGRQPGALSVWWSRNQRRIVPYFFLAPFLLSFLLFTVYPAGAAFFLSFQRVRGFISAEEAAASCWNTRGWRIMSGC